MWRWIQKRLALRSYRRRLGPALAKRYGREPHYTVAQIRVTADQLRLDTRFMCYAFADYCSQDAFDAHHAATGEACDWAAMRHELGSMWGIGEHHAAGHFDPTADHGYFDHGHDVGHDTGHHGGGDGYHSQ